jgi:phosphate transport system substrate-binding protein
LSAVEYAQTPLVFVTRKDVKVSNLTTDEIVKIYQGKIGVWPGNVQIRIILRPAGDTDTSITKGISPGMSEALAVAAARPGMVTALTDQENADLLENTPGSFGVSTLTQIIAEKRTMKALSFNGVAPSTKNLANGPYTLVKPFLLVTAKEVSPSAQKFLDYLKTPEARRILEKTGNIVVNK